MNQETRKIKVDKRRAAKGQLETALRLWFDEADPVSIHTLAVAASELLHSIGARRGKPSQLQQWIALEPKRKRDRLRAAQNFFKHGLKDVKQAFVYYPTHGDIVLWDAVLTYSSLFKSTPLRRLYFIRFPVEYHDSIFQDAMPRMFKGVNVKQIARSSRGEFRKQLLNWLRKKPRSRAR